jgi:hypothetical protein
MKDTKRKFAIITVDTNDGDYESHTIEITEEQLVVLHHVADAIKEFVTSETNNHNFLTGECVREDWGDLSARDYYVENKKTITPEDFQAFEEMLPYCEYGSHTVTEIKILAVIGEIKLL